jgi:YVTN family beta-propeller protein
VITAVQTHTRKRSAALGVAALCALTVPALVPRANAQSHVYVANASGALVSAIDTGTNAVVATIPVGGTPTRIVASSDGSRAYVTNQSANSVSVIDTTSNTVAATIPVGASPTAIAVTPNGDWLYILTGGGLVQVVDTVLRTVVAEIPTTGTASGDIAVTADGTKVYVAAGPVTVIDTATNAVIDAFSSGSAGIELSPDGSRAYVTRMLTIFGGGLDVIDTSSKASLAFINLGVPGQLAIAPDGSRLYAAIDATWVDTGYGAGFFPGRTVAVIDPRSNTQVGLIDLGATGSNWTQQNTAKAVVITPDKRLVYISVPRLAYVAVADVNTNRVTATVPVVNPGALAANTDSAGTIVPFLIDAVDDSATYSSSGGTAVASVLANDTLGGIRPTLLHVTLSQQSSTAPSVSLDPATGAVNVAAGATVGVHRLVYRICEISTPSNCDEATVTITVRAPYVINAVNDTGTPTYGQVVANVLANDKLAGVTATLSTVRLTQVSSTSSYIQLATATGGVFVFVGAPAGAHTLRYRICELATPLNCDDALVKVTVVAVPIDAVNDAGTVTPSGGTALANVLANDTLNSAVATTARVTIALVSSNSAGVTLNTSTGAVSVAPATAPGSYALVYRICETAYPTNCDSATVAVTVRSYPIDAVNDSTRANSKPASPVTILPSVLANDWFAGVRATIAKVSLTQVSSGSPNIVLDTATGAVRLLRKTNSGPYSLVYRICEIGNATNCDQAAVAIDLSGGG